MNAIRYITFALLVLIGLNALVGGYLFIADPSGGLMGMDIKQLDRPVFDDFLIPGILLFVLNGVLSNVTALFVMFRWKGFTALTIVQGIILSGWMIVQIFLFEQIYLIQYIVATIALGIVVCGLWMHQILLNQKRLSQRL